MPVVLRSKFFTNKSLHQQINEQVWKSFIKAFNGDDDEAFKAIHSKEVVRVIHDDNRLIGYEEY